VTTITRATDLSATAEIAVIGGSGLYELFEPSQSTALEIDTPYGHAQVTIGQRVGRQVAFLPRHGTGHSEAPHLINYRANIWALASLGVKAIISSAAVGGVSPDYPTGMLVVTDQFIDRTTGRPDTFFDQGSVQHLAAADPFDPVLRLAAIASLEALDEDFSPTGTVVVIQGPRFSTRAESIWFRAMGAHIVNMTQYPEVVLAAELNMGTVNLSFVTDADAGLSPLETEDAVSASLVFRRLREAQPRILAAIDGILRGLPEDYTPRELVAAAAVRIALERTLRTRTGSHSAGDPAASAATPPEKTTASSAE